MTENTMTVVVPEETQGFVDRLDQWAVQVVVTTDLQREAVLGVVKEAKIKRKFFNDLFNPNIKMWDGGHKAAIADKRRWTDRLDAAEKAGKKAVRSYDQEQEQIRIKEKRRLQAIADEKARRERDRLRKQAEKIKGDELRQARLEEAEEVEAPVVQVAIPQKVKGVATKRTWKARVIDLNKVPRQFMIVDMKALNALAKATKGSMVVEGVEFFEESSLAIR
jgi:hypothetical protein